MVNIGNDYGNAGNVAVMMVMLSVCHSKSSLVTAITSSISTFPF